MTGPTGEKRYFYRDPLAAAWMAKHFGMRFQFARQRNHSPWDLLIELDVNRDTGEVDESSALPPFFIHPDSLHLLEPKVGDILLSDYADSEGDFRPFVFNQGRSISKCHTIQRDGKPFHWPECEAA